MHSNSEAIQNMDNLQYTREKCVIFHPHDVKRPVLHTGHFETGCARLRDLTVSKLLNTVMASIKPLLN